MKILVTGGKGFIGSHLIEELSKEHEVVVFDIKNSPKEDIRRFEALLKNSRKVNVIVHLAALCLDSESIKRPWDYLTTNILGTINVLEVARILKIKKVINASSAAVGFKTPYGISKLHGEQLCELYSRLYGINVISLRIFNVYGEGNDKGIVREFLKRINKNLPLTIYDDGEYVRDYIHVKDVVKTIKDFIEKDYKSGVYEVGTGIGTSVNELVEIMKEITEKDIKIKYKPRPYEIIKYSVSTRPCVKNPIKLRDGLRELWEKSL
ncbi:MAG: NAD-dependent epimerase/dehydratase family protein [Candidatus Aenigmatarchaeota archaeon]